MKNCINEIISHVNDRDTTSFLNFYSSSDDRVKLPETSKLYLYLVLRGVIQLPDMTELHAGEYIISVIDSPYTAKILQRPLQALSIDFTNDEIITVMLDIEGEFTQKDNDKELLNCILKLLTLSKDDNKFLQKHIKREIIFNLITGKNGRDFLEKTVKFQSPDEIYKINTWIKENYKTDFTVEDLAKKINMSVSDFHQKFKNAVGMGPIQCQKKLRLQEARRLMLDMNKNVTDAALEVGYESISQFVRDYKKVFGLTPKEDILTIKKHAKIL